MRIDDETRNIMDACDWTEFDGDLDGVPQEMADSILGMRVAFAAGDKARAELWHTPDGVDVVEDIPYIDDGVRGHLLDLYLPHDAVLRGGNKLPVYVDIHGGGFCYGYKELNRNFCTHLAAKGFAVFSLNYRPAPQTDFAGQLADVAAGYSWIRRHMGDYPIASDGVFVTGDSAGGTLALYSTAVEKSADFARQMGVEQSGLPIKGCALVSGAFDLAQYLPFVVAGADGTTAVPRDPVSTVEFIAPRFFAALAGVDPAFTHLDPFVAGVDLPPIYLCTSSDDFIEYETLELAVQLSRHGRDFELHDWKTGKAEMLGHVFPVCMSWLPESDRVLDEIRDFSYARL